MSLVSLGDLAQSFLLKRYSVAAKLDISQRATELTTGRVVDTAKHLSGDLVPIQALESSLGRLNSFQTVTKEAAVFLAALQGSLGSISNVAAGQSQTLLSAALAGTVQGVDAAASAAEQSFRTVISMLNTQVGGRSLFAGNQTQNAAVVDADTMLVQIEAAVATAGAVTPQDIEAAVGQWFSGPGGYAATGYLGGPQIGNLAIAPGEDVRLDVQATDPGLLSTLKALATGALLGRGALAGQPAARQDLAQRAGTALLVAQSDLTYLSARVGANEAQVEDANTRNLAESAALALTLNNLLSVDPYEAATKLQESQTQLEKIYVITARMSRLSFTEYMR
jgi:flagellar hook-associated protein 3 FlgL